MVSGLVMYDALAGQGRAWASTQFLGRARTIECLPTARTEGLKGGVKYWDGQFDDARLALALGTHGGQPGRPGGQLLPCTRHWCTRLARWLVLCAKTRTVASGSRCAPARW